MIKLKLQRCWEEDCLGLFYRSARLNGVQCPHCGAGNPTGLGAGLTGYEAERVGLPLFVDSESAVFPVKSDLVDGYVLLRKLIQQGRVSYDAGEYVGVTSAGLQVVLGVDERSAAAYLAKYPTPDRW